MKKGQDDPKRDTLLRVKYGKAATGNVGKHLDLWDKLKRARALFEMVSGLAEDEKSSNLRSVSEVWAILKSSSVSESSVESVPKRLHENHGSGVTREQVESRKEDVLSLEREIAASWEKIKNYPEDLLKLARVAEQNRATAEGGKTVAEGARYSAEYVVLLMHMSGIKDRPTLLKIASEVDETFTTNTLSRIIKRHNLVVLTKGKPGPQPGKEKRSGKKR